MDLLETIEHLGVRFPYVSKLWESGDIKVDDSGEIYGVASDGVKVNLGDVKNLVSLERYLMCNPNTKDW